MEWTTRRRIILVDSAKRFGINNANSVANSFSNTCDTFDDVFAKTNIENECQIEYERLLKESRKQRHQRYNNTNENQLGDHEQLSFELRELRRTELSNELEETSNLYYELKTLLENIESGSFDDVMNEIYTYHISNGVKINEAIKAIHKKNMLSEKLKNDMSQSIVLKKSSTNKKMKRRLSKVTMEVNKPIKRQELKIEISNSDSKYFSNENISRKSSRSRKCARCHLYKNMTDENGERCRCYLLTYELMYTRPESGDDEFIPSHKPAVSFKPNKYRQFDSFDEKNSISLDSKRPVLSNKLSEDFNENNSDAKMSFDYSIIDRTNDETSIGHEDTIKFKEESVAAYSEEHKPPKEEPNNTNLRRSSRVCVLANNSISKSKKMLDESFSQNDSYVTTQTNTSQGNTSLINSQQISSSSSKKRLDESSIASAKMTSYNKKLNLIIFGLDSFISADNTTANKVTLKKSNVKNNEDSDLFENYENLNNTVNSFDNDKFLKVFQHLSIKMLRKLCQYNAFKEISVFTPTEKILMDEEFFTLNDVKKSVINGTLLTVEALNSTLICMVMKYITYSGHKSEANQTAKQCIQIIDESVKKLVDGCVSAMMK